MKQKILLAILSSIMITFSVTASDQIIITDPEASVADNFIPYSDFFVDLNDLYKYNIIALQDADINCHIRGSIWVGNTLTGNQYVDDGSIGGIPASDSYIYSNLSSIHFKSRTEYQGAESYFRLTDAAVQNATEYWTSMLSNFPNNRNFVYVAPDENGFVNLKYWDYFASGGDEAQLSIPIVYYTDATSVEMGGLQGHLIAPFADINIVSCNHCGSILGRNIYTDGESHINYWTPDLKNIQTASLSITKTLAINNEYRTLLFATEPIDYYVALFEDADLSLMIPGTERPISFNQTAISSITYEGLEVDKIYYFAETDGMGNVLGVNDIFTISYDEGQEIYLTEDSNISFTNLFPDLPDGYFVLTPTPTPIPTNTPTPVPTDTPTPIPYKPTPVDTGDTTTITLYILLCLVAAVIYFSIIINKKK